MMIENRAGTLSLTIRKRCKRCLHALRDDGTCQNENCKLYVPNNDNGTDDNSENKNVMFI